MSGDVGLRREPWIKKAGRLVLPTGLLVTLALRGGALARDQPVGCHYDHATDDGDDDALDIDAGHIGDLPPG